MRMRRFSRSAAIPSSRATYSSPQASDSCSQSSSVPPSTTAHSAGSGASPACGQSALRRRSRTLFHSIW